MERDPRRREQPEDGVGFYFADEDAELVARERQAHMAKLREIPAERARLAERERSVVHFARQLGISWDEIAAVIGGTGGEALAEYGEPPPGADPF